MSRWQFERPSVADAVRFLSDRRNAIAARRRGSNEGSGMLMAEAYHDALRCQRRLRQPMTPDERKLVDRFEREASP